MSKCNRGLVGGQRMRWFALCLGLGYLWQPVDAVAQTADPQGLAAFDVSGLGVTQKVDWYVTSDNPPNGGTHVTTPGVAVNGLNHDGVGRLFIDNNAAPGLGSICSCSLLGGGQALLTAAHCVTNNAGVKNVIDGQDGNTVTFNLAGGPQTFNFNSAGVMVAPGYNGDSSEGNDIAVISLAGPVPANIPRYAIWSAQPAAKSACKARKSATESPATVTSGTITIRRAIRGMIHSGPAPSGPGSMSTMRMHAASSARWAAA